MGKTSSVSFLSTLFLVVACIFTGGALGIIIGFGVISPSGHGLAQIGAYIIGAPLGALVGLTIGLFVVRKLSLKYRFRIGSLILILGGGIMLRLYLLYW